MSIIAYEWEKIIDRELFYKITGLNFPETVKCTCDGVRAICDLFLEVAALQEHPPGMKLKK
ncbi:WSSV541 [White spot syndrome virus]|uniref:WSSV541 n=1 Tax=White spot syndrome virus TaxID=342409 RepID=A0A2I6SCI8_9VIRU|nr:WSSV541 [White spot syndrome virus]